MRRREAEQACRAGLGRFAVDWRVLSALTNLRNVNGFTPTVRERTYSSGIFVSTGDAFHRHWTSGVKGAIFGVLPSGSSRSIEKHDVRA
jgi:hypothetical protein